MKNRRNTWFAIRKDLSPTKKRLMTFISFLSPLAIWCLVSYSSFFWHPDVKLQISADRPDITTVYTFGDHLSKEFFPTFRQSVQKANQDILAMREAENPDFGSARNVRRANLKKIRHLAPLAINEGWLSSELEGDDAAVFQLWVDIADGKIKHVERKLEPRNLEIIKENVALLLEFAESYSATTMPDTPLLSLIPQGISANPSYLPAPHEVLISGYEIFTNDADGDGESMTSRLMHSLKIVLGGFLISCIIGVPIGILCGTFDFFSKLFEPFIDFFRYMPAPVFSTLLVAIFLAHDAPKIALVFLGTFFQMVLMVANTTRRLDLSLLEAAQTLGAKSRHLLWKVTIPGILPALYNDLRILLGWSWTWLVIAELIGVKSGLTEFIETQGRWRNFDQVYPVIIVIGVIGFTTDQFLSSMYERIFPYLNQGKTPESIFAKMSNWATADRIDPRSPTKP